ncbi:MAG: hypothetical protein GX112_05130 [Clostridiaceae bacterium]|jgi:phosphoesterase RecJ-like protein|nr:hypothetical protein [Clostridiaceae bacterium]
MKQKIDRLAAHLLSLSNRRERVDLFPHVNLDGDALGSALALLLALEKLSVAVRLPLDEPVPPKLDFLPALAKISPVDTAGTGWMTQPEHTLALLLDCADPQRTGKREPGCVLASERWVLDHHIARRPLGETELVDTGAAACAELVYDLLRSLEMQSGIPLLGPDEKMLLMTALISDTGGFVYSNTSARSFTIAADLIHREMDLRQITYRLFHQSSLARLRLKGYFCSQARFSFDDRIVSAAVDPATLDLYQATDDDLDGMINELKNVAGVDLAMILRLQADGQIRVNLRTSTAIDASQLAALFGGGGHPRAAGMTLEGWSLVEAETMLLQKAGDALSHPCA